MVAYLSLSRCGGDVGWGGHLFEAGRLLPFPAFRMDAYSRWAPIRVWELIRINAVFTPHFLRSHLPQDKQLCPLLQQNVLLCSAQNYLSKPLFFIF